MVADGVVITATVLVEGVPVQLAAARSKMLTVPAADVFTVTVWTKPETAFTAVAVVAAMWLY